jgi:hypothetical protein
MRRETLMDSPEVPGEFGGRGEGRTSTFMPIATEGASQAFELCCAPD